MTITVSASPSEFRIATFAVALFLAGSLITPSLPVLLPHMTTHLAVGFSALGFMLGTMFAVGSLSLFVWGYFLDRRREGAVLAGALTALVIGVGLLVGTNIYGVSFTGAVLLGIGAKCLPFLGLIVLVRHISPNRFGLWYLVMLVAGTLGNTLAPVAVSVLAGILGWQFGLVLAIVLIAVLCGTMAAFCLKKVTTIETRPDGWADASKPHADRSLMMICLAIVLVVTALQAHMFLTISVVALEHIQSSSAGNQDAREWHRMIAVTRVSLGLAGLVAGALIADRVRRPGLWVGYSLLLAAFATLTFVLFGKIPIWGVWVSASVIAFALGVAAIPVLKLFIQCLERRYLAVGLATLFVLKDVGSSQVGAVGGWIVDQNGSSAFVIIAVAIFALAAGLILFVSRNLSAPVPQSSGSS